MSKFSLGPCRRPRQVTHIEKLYREESDFLTLDSRMCDVRYYHVFILFVLLKGVFVALSPRFSDQSSVCRQGLNIVKNSGPSVYSDQRSIPSLRTPRTKMGDLKVEK